ncbi:MAG: hypothetical protein VW258_08625, partial [Thalassolituus sp.]
NPLIRLGFTVPRSDKTRKHENKACQICPKSPSHTVWITTPSLHSLDTRMAESKTPGIARRSDIALRSLF